MVKAKKYTIEGLDRDGKPAKLKATQTELTFNKTKELILLLEGLSIQDLAKRGLRGVFEYLDANELFERFFDLILNAKTKPSQVVELGTVADSLLLDIVDDFFLLNRKSITRLVAFFQGKKFQTSLALYLKNWITSLRPLEKKSPDPENSTT